ncbi:hypothetical protein ANCDUO_15579 [Ancylostoma duodenale]|uniref:Uncharacterized protein n=1 Tax=Ancylostoma duodenale TaxID=51022 RepID=A0A0C2GBG0_9BILA|nr:hypothetical protein ANCDUO_15579 [Ancylostoma duodenale]
MHLNDNRWTRAVSDWTPRNLKRTTGRPPTPWSDFFTKSFKERYNALRVPRAELAPARYIRRSTGVKVIKVNTETLHTNRL